MPFLQTNKEIRRTPSSDLSFFPGKWGEEREEGWEKLLAHQPTYSLWHQGQELLGDYLSYPGMEGASLPHLTEFGVSFHFHSLTVSIQTKTQSHSILQRLHVITQCLLLILVRRAAWNMDVRVSEVRHWALKAYYTQEWQSWGMWWFHCYFLRNLQTDFRSVCTSLCSREQ